MRSRKSDALPRNSMGGTIEASQGGAGRITFCHRLRAQRQQLAD